MENLLSTLEAARFLGLSKWTLAVWKKKGKIEFVRLGSRTMFIKEDLERFVKENRIEVKPVQQKIIRKRVVKQ